MTKSKVELCERFQQYYLEFPTIGLAIDISRMNFPDNYLVSMETCRQEAFLAMAELGFGGIANLDETRMIGHYWQRKPSLAPTQILRREIEDTHQTIKAFATQVHDGNIRIATGQSRNLLVIGIGDSAMSAQFVSDALGQPGKGKLAIHFCCRAFNCISTRIRYRPIDFCRSAIQRYYPSTPCGHESCRRPCYHLHR